MSNSSGSNINSDRNDGIQRVYIGRQAQDIPVPADYDGDGITDFAVYRLDAHIWCVKNSSGSHFNSSRNDGIQRILFGGEAEDIPLAADFDGDGIADMGFRRSVTQNWFVRLSSSGEIIENTFGNQEQDIPVVADYDGDGRADFAVRRPSENKVFIRRSSDNGIERVDGGIATDIPVAAPMSHILEMLAN